MKDEFEEIIVSTKNVKKRTVFLILAIVTAIVAFTVGIGRLTHKEEGYYQIEASLPEEASHAGDGIALALYLRGKSGEIRDALNRVKDLYNTELVRSYKLLDEKQEYEGYTNLASINSSVGKPVEIGEELRTILQDADQRSREGHNFNLYANCLTEEWDRILSLTEPEEFDPVFNQDSEERIRELSALCRDLTQFSLKTEDEGSKTVTLQVSEYVLRRLTEMEYDGGILGLGRLKEAYRLQMICKALEDEGFTDGYITTNTGLSVALKDYEKGLLTVYGWDEGEAKQMASVTISRGGTAVMLRAFPMNEREALYYRIKTEAGDIYRNPWFSVRSGGYANLLFSCAVLSEGNIVETTMKALDIFALDEPEEIEGTAKNTGDQMMWTLQSDPGKLYSNSDCFEAVAEGVQTVKID